MREFIDVSLVDFHIVVFAASTILVFDVPLNIHLNLLACVCVLVLCDSRTVHHLGCLRLTNAFSHVTWLTENPEPC